MKIGDIEVGVEYGALDAPRATGYRHDRLPRRVKVLEIVTEEQKKHNPWAGPGSGSTRIVKKRKVKVECLTEPFAKHRYAWGIDNDAKGTRRVIEARQLVAPWADLKESVSFEVEEEIRRKAFQATLIARFEKLLGEDAPWVTVDRLWNEEGSARDRLNPSAHLSGPELLRILELAERGAEHAPEKGASA